MGDSRRFKAISDLICRNFKPCKVADVAGGGGMLSFELAQKGFDCTVIDPRKTDLPKEYRLKHRRGHKTFKRERKLFTRGDAIDYDLIIGLHPDGATKEICISSLTKPVFIVPCCNHWEGTTGDMVRVVDKFLTRNNVAYRMVSLPIRGQHIGFLTGR
jgi:hypothetical protein